MQVGIHTSMQMGCQLNVSSMARDEAQETRARGASVGAVVTQDWLCVPLREV